MTTITTADQIAGARRLHDLADEADTERKRWKDKTIRHELLRIRLQLDHAARLALTASDTWADAWAEAAVLTLNKYRASRRLITALGHRPTYQTLDCRDGVHAGCLTCGCECHAS